MNLYLPDYVRVCIDALEEAGFEAWAVGGCVRDACLGRTPNDYDICTNALPDETREVFRDYEMFLAGLKHGTVSVLSQGNVIEITTFRTEGEYLDSRHPEWVAFVPDVREDLARRDFTVNAMAWSPTRGLMDPFGGREDLEKGILRAVGDPYARFREDALRILRGVRFAVRYGLTVEEKTFAAMGELRQLLDALSRERVFTELCGILPLIGAEQLAIFAPVLTAAIPELEPMVGFDQRSPHHAYDLYTHTARVTEAVAPDLALRWAALLHDVGKVACFTVDETGRGHFYGHAGVSARQAEEILRRLRAPNALREQVCALIGLHMTRLEEDERLLKRRISRLGWDTVELLLQLQEADMGSKGTGKAEELDQFPRIRALLQKIREQETCLSLKDLALNGRDMIALGLKGKQIGAMLEKLLDGVLEGTLPNEREALLEAAKRNIQEEHS